MIIYETIQFMLEGRVRNATVTLSSVKILMEYLQSTVKIKYFTWNYLSAVLHQQGMCPRNAMQPVHNKEGKIYVIWKWSEQKVVSCLFDRTYIC